LMTFYFSDTAVLLFDFWNVHSPTGMVLSVLVILLLSVLYEAVKMGKAVLLQRALLALPRSLSQEALSEPPEEDSRDSSPAQSRWFWFHVGQTLFHVLQVVLGYMVMLAVMSYNGWIFLGAIAGSTLGYFLVYPCWAGARAPCPGGTRVPPPAPLSGIAAVTSAGSAFVPLLCGTQNPKDWPHSGDGEPHGQHSPCCHWPRLVAVPGLSGTSVRVMTPGGAGISSPLCFSRRFILAGTGRIR
uniref:Copper transport protein n=1 Tax=Catharus ustulatus TaxID=91951 RepID=A0A8C3VCV7_CATUS